MCRGADTLCQTLFFEVFDHISRDVGKLHIPEASHQITD